MEPLDQRQVEHARLVAELQSTGVLDTGWRPVFDAVPRDRFIPDRIWRQGSERCEPVTTEQERRALVASDEPVVIQVDDGRENGPGVATSSNSQPSMVAKMLGLLDIREGHRVLEIGTASGYVAALLSERLGAANVVSVELDRDLARQARSTLHAAGYVPTVVCADGAAGWPRRAPYDRIVSTCALDRVPFELVRQTVAGGLLVAPLTRRFLSGALVCLTVDKARATASGTFRGGASYMPMRSHRPASGTPVDATSGRSATSALKPRQITSLAFSLYASARLPGVSLVAREEAGTLRVWLQDGAGSGATTAEAEPLWQYGSRDLWSEVEEVFQEYEELGAPGVNDIGLTVRDSGQHVWVGGPGTVVLPREGGASCRTDHHTKQ